MGTTDESISEATGLILSRIKPGMEDRYRQWAIRIQAAQARYPGYRGIYLQPPTDDGPQARWTTFVRYDTPEHLEAWMQSSERASLLEEAGSFVDDVELVRLATSFPGWVPVDPATGQAPPDWKTALLVLLGLFPLVMLEIRYLNPVFERYGWNWSLATFLTNAGNVAATSFITMPLFVRWFDGWLYPTVTDRHATQKGIAVLALLFTVEVAACWHLLH